MNTIRIAQPNDIEAVASMFEEYREAFGFTPCFNNFDKEVASLPGRYDGPDGRLLIGLVDEDIAGCVALKRVDATICEMARLWVKPDFRGQRVANDLVERLIAEARLIGYKSIQLETIPDTMVAAIKLYERVGFTVRDEKSECDSSGVWMEMEL